MFKEGERREQVFVSSTYVDLREERREVIQALLEANCIPAGMEMFPATDLDSWSLIEREISASDYYVVIVGARYGSTDESGLSFTEREFDFAVQSGVPIMGFLHGDPGEIPGKHSDLDADSKARLAAFTAKIKERNVRFFSSPADLGGRVSRSLIKIRQSHPAQGWVRAEHAMTPELENELKELRLRVRELEASLREERTTSRSSVHNRDLAAGDENFEIELWFEYYSTDTPVPEYGRREATKTTLHADATWNEILSTIGVRMLIEADEDQISSALRALCNQRVKDLPGDVDDQVGHGCREASVRAILVQLKALGLIEESSRRHPISDYANYWQLTPAGHEEVMRLSTIEKAPDEALDHAEGDDSDDVPSTESAVARPAKSAKSAKKSRPRKASKKAAKRTAEKRAASSSKRS